MSLRRACVRACVSLHVVYEQKRERVQSKDAIDISAFTRVYFASPFTRVQSASPFTRVQSASPFTCVQYGSPVTLVQFAF